MMRVFDGLRRAAAVAFLATGLAVPSWGAAQPAAGELDPEVLGPMIRNYLLTHPEVVVEAIEAYQARQDALEAERVRERLVSYRASIDAPAFRPVLGNPDAGLTVIHFFDYNCGFCKRMREDVNAVLEADPDLRFAQIEFPILAESSAIAARAALAADRQDLYEPFHNALMAYRGTLDEGIIFAIAEGEGLDLDRLRADMGDPTVTATLQANRVMAEALGIRGTPAYVIGDRVIPGAVGVPGLVEAITAARRQG